jgi:hypothetical protein
VLTLLAVGALDTRVWEWLLVRSIVDVDRLGKLTVTGLGALLGNVALLIAVAASWNAWLSACWN